MEYKAEISELVEATRRLYERHGNTQSSFQTNNIGYGACVVTDQSELPAPRLEGTFWPGPSYTTPPPGILYHPQNTDEPGFCCPRCQLVIDPKPFLATLALRTAKDDADGINSLSPPPSGTNNNNVTDIRQLLSLQLASLEHARLLSALGNATQPTSPFYTNMLPTDIKSGGITSSSLLQQRALLLVGFKSACSLSQLKRKNSSTELEPLSTEQTIPLKRSRLVWTKELHARFEQAIAKLGFDKAVPRAILEVMNVEGLTRENVASHLQKYRQQLAQRQTHEQKSSAATESEKHSCTRSAGNLRANESADSTSTASDAQNTDDITTIAALGEK